MDNVLSLMVPGARGLRPRPCGLEIPALCVGKNLLPILAYHLKGVQYLNIEKSLLI